MENTEKQIEEIADLIYDNTEFDTMWSEIDASAKAIYNAGYRKQSEWISVDEKLPEIGKCVLIYSNESGVAEGQRSATQDWVQFRWSASNVDVTHWMPLPEAPKGGE